MKCGLNRTFGKRRFFIYKLGCISVVTIIFNSLFSSLYFGFHRHMHTIYRQFEDVVVDFRGK